MPTVIGSVGWEDEEDHFFAGSMDDDGLTFVRVQLIQGRDTTKPLSDRAQGTKILCQLSDGMFSVPPKNAKCYVAIPDGMEDCVGIGVIIATVTPGKERRQNIAAGNQFLSASEGEASVLINKNGSVTLHTTADNTPEGPSAFFRVSTKAFQFVAPWGRMIFDASGLHWTTHSGARLDMGGIDLSSIPGIGVLPLEVLASLTTYCKITAGQIKCNGSTYVGAASPAGYQPGCYAPIKPLPAPQPPIGVAAPTDVLQSQSFWVAQ